MRRSRILDFCKNDVPVFKTLFFQCLGRLCTTVMHLFQLNIIRIVVATIFWQVIYFWFLVGNQRFWFLISKRIKEFFDFRFKRKQKMKSKSVIRERKQMKPSTHVHSWTSPNYICLLIWKLTKQLKIYTTSTFKLVSKQTKQLDSNVIDSHICHFPHKLIKKDDSTNFSWRCVFFDRWTAVHDLFLCKLKLAI